MSTCEYTTIAAQAFGSLQLSSWFVWIALLAFSFTIRERKRVYAQAIFALFSTFVTICALCPYLFQTMLHDERPDPFCPWMKTSGFPSIPVFFSTVISVFIMEITFWWNICFSWTAWILVLLTLGGPPLFFCFISFNTPREVGISMGLGALFPTVFMLLYVFFLADAIPYLVNQAPLCYLNCVDTWTEGSEEKAHQIKLQLKSIREKLSSGEEGV